jgi:hypothetical protein
MTLLVMGALFEEALSKISHFHCVVESWTVGELRWEFGEEAMEAWYKEHNGESLEVPFV